ncbi:MBL fold metallo-hydrolase [Streptomyces sp. NPDC005151]
MCAQRKWDEELVGDGVWETCRELNSAVPHEHYAPDTYRLRPAGVSRYLTDGDTIDLGNRQLTVLHLPGHTPGSIALYDPRAQMLFSGDIVYDDRLLDDIHGADQKDYVATMGRLRDRTERSGRNASRRSSAAQSAAVAGRVPQWSRNASLYAG